MKAIETLTDKFARLILKTLHLKENEHDITKVRTCLYAYQKRYNEELEAQQAQEQVKKHKHKIK